MRAYRLRSWACGLAIAAVIGLVGCTGGTGGDNTNENGTGEPGQPGPPLSLCDPENDPPSGDLVYPSENALVAAGGVAFIWEANDSDDPIVRSTIYVSDQPSVFENPLLTQELDLGAAVLEHRTTIQLPLESGRLYWGIEISDLCLVGSDPQTIRRFRRPVDELGVPFDVTVLGDLRTGAPGAILLCPSGAQRARQRTTFDWSLDDAFPSPTRTQVFVSRAGDPNPFDSPLRVFDVTPPTASSWAMTPDDQPLPADQALAWGLRVQTADLTLDLVQFTGEGESGQSFTAGPNVPPSGELLAPPDGTVLADDTPLQWQADPGNCEDELTSTIFFEFLEETLADAAEPQSLFDSSFSLEVGTGQFELNVLPLVAELNLRSGVWAWGVLADDGTDQIQLIDPEKGISGGAVRDQTQLADLEPGLTFRTFVQPRCLSDAECGDGDLCNGADTCVDGTCQAGTALNCDDGDVCNGTETCDPLVGCVPGTPLACDDGNACNGAETCDPVAGCQAGTPLNCNDGNACTADFCAAASGCIHTAINCGDGNACNGVETCDLALGCQAGTPLDCDDSNACTLDVCINGDCVNDPIIPCCGNDICESEFGENFGNCPEDCLG